MVFLQRVAGPFLRRIPKPLPSTSYTPSYRRQDTANRLKLACLLEGQPFRRTFTVGIDDSACIDDLKELIKEKKKSVLAGFDTADLDVYSACIPAEDETALHEIYHRIAKQDSSLPKVMAWETIAATISRSIPGHIQVVLGISDSAHTSKPLGKQTIAQAFPNGLEYRPPQPLPRAVGMDGYRPHRDLHEDVKRHLEWHFRSYCKGRIDKSVIPTYFFASGAGTDKSRNATKFHRTLVKCSEQGSALRARLEGAKVFHVGFENGTSPPQQEMADPLGAIGLRMLHQLLGPKMSIYEVTRKYEAPCPSEIFRLVAQREGVDLFNEFTGVLVIDGLQRFLELGDDGQNKIYMFNTLLNNIADTALDKRGIFIIPCCTATITPALEHLFALSSRYRAFLPVSSLDSPTPKKGGIASPWSFLV